MYTDPTQAISRASNPHPFTVSVVRTNLDSVTSLANTLTKLGAEHFCFYLCPGILLQTKTAKLGATGWTRTIGPTLIPAFWPFAMREVCSTN